MAELLFGDLDPTGCPVLSNAEAEWLGHELHGREQGIQPQVFYSEGKNAGQVIGALQRWNHSLDVASLLTLHFLIEIGIIEPEQHWNHLQSKHCNG
jgi:hypothetical protein